MHKFISWAKFYDKKQFIAFFNFNVVLLIRIFLMRGSGSSEKSPLVQIRMRKKTWRKKKFQQLKLKMFYIVISGYEQLITLYNIVNVLLKSFRINLFTVPEKCGGGGKEWSRMRMRNTEFERYFARN